jgi:hypothetical protein
LGEDSAPSDTNELARRKSFFNEAYKKVLNENYWWFLLTIGAQASVDGQEIYTLPSTFRDVKEVRLNRKVCKFIPQEDAFGTYNYPPLYYSYHSIVQKFFIYGESELHLLPVPDSTPSTLSISGITRSGSIATATSTSAHGLQAGDYVAISGSDQADYNGTVRVASAPSTTTFTYTVSNSPTTPATGTMTAQWQNIVYRFYQYPSMLSADSDTVVIPDQFADILVAYAYGRYGFIDDTRANSADGFEEYNQILGDMVAEHNRRNTYEKATPPQQPQTIYE